MRTTSYNYDQDTLFFCLCRAAYIHYSTLTPPIFAIVETSWLSSTVEKIVVYSSRNNTCTHTYNTETLLGNISGLVTVGSFSVLRRVPAAVRSVWCQEFASILLLVPGAQAYELDGSSCAPGDTCMMQVVKSNDGWKLIMLLDLIRCLERIMGVRVVARPTPSIFSLLCAAKEQCY